MTDPDGTAPDPVLTERLQAAAAGDAVAWRWLVEQYAGRVYGLLWRRCGDAELSEELAQVTFVKVYECLARDGGYQERGRFEAWLFRIASNNLRDEMRRRRRHALPVGGLGASADGEGGGSTGPGGWSPVEDRIVRDGGRAAPGGGVGPLEAAGRAEQVRLLREAVGRMSEADREILHLRHTAGLSFAQIAETLGQPLGTVLARGHRALKKLRAALEQVGVEV